jgi:hypothetical protein
MASSADLVARAPLYPAPDLVAYLDAIECDLYARAPLYGAPDLVAYWPGRPASVAAAPPSTLTLTPDPGALTLAGGPAPSIAAAGTNISRPAGRRPGWRGRR